MALALGNTSIKDLVDKVNELDGREVEGGSPLKVITDPVLEADASGSYTHSYTITKEAQEEVVVLSCFQEVSSELKNVTFDYFVVNATTIKVRLSVDTLKKIVYASYLPSSSVPVQVNKPIYKIPLNVDNIVANTDKTLSFTEVIPSTDSTLVQLAYDLENSNVISNANVSIKSIDFTRKQVVLRSDSNIDSAFKVCILVY